MTKKVKKNKENKFLSTGFLVVNDEYCDFTENNNLRQVKSQKLLGHVTTDSFT